MNATPMTQDRLAQLAAAWGAEPRRWPAPEREAARAWIAAHPAAADRVLFAARQMDAALNTSRGPAVSAALRERVIASAASAGLVARSVWPGLRRLLWLGGAGWAAAACAGVILGTTLSGQRDLERQIEAVLEESTLSGLDDTAVLG